MLISGSGCENQKITDFYFKKETGWCCDNSSDKSSNNQKLSEEDLERCIQINTKFYKLKEDLRKRFNGNNELRWQTTPVIGLQESVYKEGGAIIIGYNEHVKKENESNEDEYNDNTNLTGLYRDNKLLNEYNGYHYYKFFTKEETPISKRFGTNIKFMELIPIKSSSKKETEILFKPRKKEIEIEYYCFEGLMYFLSLLKPKLIICNDKTVSCLFEQECDAKREPQTHKDSVVTVNIEGEKVKVILSGQITGRNPIDKYNEIRFWKEIKNILGGE